MKRCIHLAVLVLGAVVLLWGCTTAPWTPVRSQVAAGDRQREWALVYYQSWRRAHDERYLRLARQRMTRAIRTYFQAQVQMGHTFPDFYVVDRKRRESCDFLDEIDRMAFRFRVSFEERSREGCLR